MNNDGKTSREQFRSTPQPGRILTPTWTTSTLSTHFSESQNLQHVVPTALTVNISEKLPCTEYCKYRTSRHASYVEILHVTQFVPRGAEPDPKCLLAKIGDVGKAAGEVQNYF